MFSMVVEVKTRYVFDRWKFLNFQGLRNLQGQVGLHLYGFRFLHSKKPPNKLHRHFKGNKPIQKLEQHVRTHCRILRIQNTSYNFLQFCFWRTKNDLNFCHWMCMGSTICSEPSTSTEVVKDRLTVSLTKVHSCVGSASCSWPPFKDDFSTSDVGEDSQEHRKCHTEAQFSWAAKQ